jgi:hypothetical protein
MYTANEPHGDKGEALSIKSLLMTPLYLLYLTTQRPLTEREVYALHSAGDDDDDNNNFQSRWMCEAMMNKFFEAGIRV